MALPAYLGTQAEGAAASVLNRLLGRKPKTGMVNPKKYKDDIVISDADLAGAKAQVGRTAQRTMQPAVSEMRRQFAFDRMPGGTLAGAMEKMGYRSGQAVTEAAPRFLDVQRQSQLDFRNLQNQYGIAREQARRLGASRYNLTPEIGSLTKTMMLYQAGLMGKKSTYEGDPEIPQVLNKLFPGG